MTKLRPLPHSQAGWVSASIKEQYLISVSVWQLGWSFRMRSSVSRIKRSSQRAGSSGINHRSFWSNAGHGGAVFPAKHPPLCFPSPLGWRIQLFRRRVFRSIWSLFPVRFCTGWQTHCLYKDVIIDIKLSPLPILLFSLFSADILTSGPSPIFPPNLSRTK